jgi:ATP-dependent exoDNAse (exonuclease V) beta subunit
MNTLSDANVHDRDRLIKFYSSGHKYEISTDKKTKYTSVTTWVHTHFPKFDADAVINNIFNGKNWNPTNKYWNMTAEEIKNSWKTAGQTSCVFGTKLHERIETFMNISPDNTTTTVDTENTENKTIGNLLQQYNLQNQQTNEAPEWNYFIQFVQDYHHLKPYRTEWMIFDEDLKIAGSIDMVFENDDGTLSIYDWKRCKEIIRENNWNKFASNEIISHLPDTNFWHYSLQLNTYKAILERKYGKTIKELYLVRLHPDDDAYELIEVPILNDEIVNLFEKQLEMVSKKINA